MHLLPSQFPSRVFHIQLSHHTTTTMHGRNNRKRKPEIPVSSGDTNILIEDPPIPQPSANNIVDDSKVKQYLNRLEPSQADGSKPACTKIIVCLSEGDLITAEFEEMLKADFSVSSVSVSDPRPLCVDRFITIHGTLTQVLRCTIYLAFVLCAKLNNPIKVKPFTLKSQNYKVDVLLETCILDLDEMLKKFPQDSIDVCEYECNFGLHHATLLGDFSSLFNSLVFLFDKLSYSKYSSDAAIGMYDFIHVNESDILYTPTEDTKDLLEKNKQKILDTVYNASYIRED